MAIDPADTTQYTCPDGSYPTLDPLIVIESMDDPNLNCEGKVVDTELSTYVGINEE